MRTIWISSEGALSWNMCLSDRQRLTRSGAARQLYVLPGGMQVCTVQCLHRLHCVDAPGRDVAVCACVQHVVDTACKQV